MRHLLAFTLFAVAVFGRGLEVDKVQPYIFEDVINETIEGLRADIPETIEADPLDISLPADDPDAVVTGTANLTNLELTGLHDFEVTALNFSLVGPELDFTLDLPLLHLFTDFDLDLSILNSLSIYGDGNLTLHLEQLEIVASATVNLTGAISLSNLVVQIKLDSAHIDIYGLLNDDLLSETVSSILNDLAVPLIDENPELVSQIISPIAESIINSVIGGVLQEPEEIIKDVLKIVFVK